MCGIGGIIRLDGGEVEKHRLEAINQNMLHRGPDGEGYWIKGPVGLAHLRLAIIDLVTGDQPMINDEGTVVIIFNGEIYNFLELKPELSKLGHSFKTTSDTEVLLHAYEEWGPAMLARINGMFGFAIYDLQKNMLFIARDRLGVKPLYYYHGKDCLVFASEMGGMLASGLIPDEVNLEALDLYLHYQYIPSPFTIYQNVHKLCPAEYLILDLSTRKLTTQKYWQVNTDKQPDTSKSVENWLEELDSLINDAVSIRLISDVPFGAFLSGGVDSGLVVSMMAGKLNEPVKTFSIGLDGVDKDELPFARQVAEQYRTHHEEFRVTPQGLSLIPTLSRHFSEPFADSSAIPTYYVSQIASSRVKMVLTGDGGDEMFGGYRSYPNLMRSLQQAVPPSLIRALSMVNRDSGLRDMPRQVARNLRSALRNMLNGPIPWYSIFDVSMRHFNLPERRSLLGDSRPISGEDYFADLFPFPAADSAVGKAQYLDLNAYLPGDVLAKVDRMSMAHSLEVRSPLLDYRVAEMAFSIPTKFKVPETLLDGTKNKFILKELAASRYLSREYVYRPKEGFGIPVSRWLREDENGYVKDSLLSNNSPIYNLVNRNFAQHLVKTHLSGSWDYGYKVWNLLMLDGWMRYVHQSHKHIAQ